MAAPGRRAEIQKYDLDEQACDYVRKSLGAGGALAEHVLERTLIGQPFTLLPTGLPTDVVTRFSAGGYFQVGSEVWIDWISTQLLQTPRSLLFAEDFEVEPSSPLLLESPEFVIAEGAVVYFTTHVASISSVMREMSRYPSILVIATNDGPPLSARQTLDSERIARFAASARYTLVGAYDEETFICARCGPGYS